MCRRRKRQVWNGRATTWKRCDGHFDHKGGVSTSCLIPKQYRPCKATYIPLIVNNGDQPVKAPERQNVGTATAGTILVMPQPSLVRRFDPHVAVRIGEAATPAPSGTQDPSDAPVGTDVATGPFTDNLASINTIRKLEEQLDLAHLAPTGLRDAAIEILSEAIEEVQAGDQAPYDTHLQRAGEKWAAKLKGWYPGFEELHPEVQRRCLSAYLRGDWHAVNGIIIQLVAAGAVRPGDRQDANTGCWTGLLDLRRQTTLRNQTTGIQEEPDSDGVERNCDPFADIDEAIEKEEQMPQAQEDHEMHGPIPSDSETEHVANGVISKPKDYRPPQELFLGKPPFVAAVLRRGKPVHGGHVEGYVFTTHSGVTGYYSNDPEAMQTRSQPPIEKQHSWRKVLAEVLWPSTGEPVDPPVADVGHNPHNWVARTARVKHASDKKKAKKSSRKVQLLEILEDYNYTTAASTLAKELGLCAIDCWNMNTWHAGADTMHKSTADVQLLQ